ncbi:hypothetical protein CHARACLAT_011113, partial [Characodon lateralis]|nr:hypothetical protein [Characodon lateralis]
LPPVQPVSVRQIIRSLLHALLEASPLAQLAEASHTLRTEAPVMSFKRVEHQQQCTQTGKWINVLCAAGWKAGGEKTCLKKLGVGSGGNSGIKTTVTGVEHCLAFAIDGAVDK